MVRIDLHVHTRASDGVLGPGDVVLRAHRQDVGILAITDHDSVAGVPAAQRAGFRLGVTVVPGLELGCKWGLEEVHILGLWINVGNPLLRASLRKLQLAREKRVQGIVGRLQRLGVPVSRSQVRRLAAGGVPGRVHVARALMEMKVVLSVDEAFGRFLAPGRPGYVPRYRLHPQQALALVQTAGGLSVLAHPGSMNIAFLSTLQSWGLNGVEVFTPHHRAVQTRRWHRWCRLRGLLPTGGSDFHGLPEEGGELGSFVTLERWWHNLCTARALRPRGWV